MTMAPVTILREAKGRQLVHVGAGWEPAGAGLRQTDGYYAVRWWVDGGQYGRRFRDLDEAMAYWEKAVKR